MWGDGTAPDGKAAARVCEEVGSYRLIECANRDEAVHAASRSPGPASSSKCGR
jgi:hypothetical protein